MLVMGVDVACHRVDVGVGIEDAKTDERIVGGHVVDLGDAGDVKSMVFGEVVGQDDVVGGIPCQGNGIERPEWLKNDDGIEPEQDRKEGQTAFGARHGSQPVQDIVLVRRHGQVGVEFLEREHQQDQQRQPDDHFDDVGTVAEPNGLQANVFEGDLGVGRRDEEGKLVSHAAGRAKLDGWMPRAVFCVHDPVGEPFRGPIAADSVDVERYLRLVRIHVDEVHVERDPISSLLQEDGRACGHQSGAFVDHGIPGRIVVVEFSFGGLAQEVVLGS